MNKLIGGGGGGGRSLLIFVVNFLKKKMKCIKYNYAM